MTRGWTEGPPTLEQAEYRIPFLLNERAGCVARQRENARGYTVEAILHDRKRIAEIDAEIARTRAARAALQAAGGGA